MTVPILVYQPRAAQRYCTYLRDQGCDTVYPATTREEAEAILQQHPIEVVFGIGFPLDLLERYSSIRWLQLMSAGVDHVLHQGRVPARVTLTRMVGVFSRQMAEYVFAYLLHIEKGIERLCAQQREQRWKPFRAGVLTGKVIGVAGLGSIGQEVVRKARAFDMKVHGLSRTGEHADTVDRHFSDREWVDFVRELDYLVLTLPLTDQTRHVVNESVLWAMKPEAVIVNVGRGALMDESALIAALQQARLGGAVLDVFEQEPLPAESPLWRLPNVYVTPHMSGPTTVENGSTYFLENLARYQAGQALLGVVEPGAAY
ncbi:D-2-hydroxyacid dehydrogenase [Alicyclobacillus cycloheptanicus]|uniref:Glyoxylate/hydroxypyruvate reductase A n=1 Tax=Alicyclobacillus cycloheptanicus TaxID=1457 RepID=A0ABT9XFK8_9BACL|nr:D-2-hydroxyacid dehydrogenase [Alicyclobacillus cycloheptanicus]MDQ0188972.1 glyoxylate/hydroxypyruvate reductase A [Alicyclobacillus cycloheptanicus]WDM01682.1 D-2-hydroxyacid dehydrogenase [Alicyclobacillus cycloheptanicus]